MKKQKFFSALIILIVLSINANAQFNIVGSALSTGSGCYTLTNTTGQSGAVWNTTPVNLNQPFDITLTLNFGCTGIPQGDDNVANAPNCGADGISFILQPMSSGVSATGGGVGYQGITPSLGVVMDDFSGNATDPLYDHISIHQNGDVDHGTLNELAAYTTAVGFPANIEDCLDHTFRFQWTPGSPNGTANVWFDGVLTLTYSGNIVSSIFSGNPNVFWGASASTGACMNNQTVCMTIAADFSTASVCQGQATTFTDQSVSGTPISTYVWDFGDGSPTSSLQNPTHLYAAPGTYNVILTITNTAGLTSTIANSITVNPNPTVALSSPAVCAGDAATLTASGATTYSWSTGSSANPLVVSPTQTTTYTVTGTNTGCMGTAEVVVNPLPQITVNNEMICQGDTVLLTAAGGNTYSWSGGLSGNLVTVTPATSTTYTVTGTDNNGCSNTVTSMVIVNPAPAVTGSAAQLICLGESATLSASGTNLVSYLWDPAATLSSPTDPNPIATPLVSTTYTVTATNNMGCSGTAVTEVTISSVTAGFSYTTPNPGDPMTLGFTDQSGTNAVSWAWDFGNGTTSTLQNPTNTYTQPGTYTVTLVVTNAEGCTNTITQEVTVYPPFEMTIPNVFSPNSDGYNDTFGPKMEGFESFSMLIFNRWGNLIYETNSYDNLWDGTHNGKPAADGVYFFIIDVHTYGKEVFSEKGTVTLVR